MEWIDAQPDNDMNSQIQETNTHSRHPGTCEWLLKHDLFLKWISTGTGGIDSKLWLKGSPGSGKSFLCTTAIEHVSKKLHQLCLYYYYRFDDQHGLGPEQHRVRVAALIVNQLFRHFWRKDQRIAKPLNEYIKRVDRTMESLAEMARLILRHGHQYIQEERSTSDEQPITFFVFLDGIDENKGHHMVENILRLFSSLENEAWVLQKTWISSRETVSLSQELKLWPCISESLLAENDVDAFLTKAVASLEINLTMENEVEGQPRRFYYMLSFGGSRNYLLTVGS